MTRDGLHHHDYLVCFHCYLSCLTFLCSATVIPRSEASSSGRICLFSVVFSVQAIVVMFTTCSLAVSGTVNNNMPNSAVIRKKMHSSVMVCEINVFNFDYRQYTYELFILMLNHAFVLHSLVKSNGIKSATGVL